MIEINKYNAPTEVKELDIINNNVTIILFIFFTLSSLLCIIIFT